MNNRWAWNLPVLSAIAMAAASGTAVAQMAPPATPMGGQFMDPAAAMAAQSQMAAQGQFAGPAGMYAPIAQQPSNIYLPAAAYPQGAMYPGVQSAAYAGGPPAAVGAPPPQMFGPGPGGPIPDAYGSYGSVPMNGERAGYGQPMYDSQMYGGPMQGGPMPGGMPGGPMPMDGGGCPYCGGQGCEACMGGGGHHGHGIWPNGLLGDVLGLVAPYPDGGCAAVRWFDFAVDYMSLRRDNTGRNQVFTSLGSPAPGATPNIILQTNDLDFPNNRPGFRFQGALQVGPANAVEFTYFGQVSYTSSAAVVDLNNNLFSVLTDFGRTPLGGLPEFDQTAFQQIRYNSAFDSFEVMWRQRVDGAQLPLSRVVGNRLPPFHPRRKVPLFDQLESERPDRRQRLSAADHADGHRYHEQPDGLAARHRLVDLLAAGPASWRRTAGGRLWQSRRREYDGRIERPARHDLPRAAGDQRRIRSSARPIC